MKNFLLALRLNFFVPLRANQTFHLSVAHLAIAMAVYICYRFVRDYAIATNPAFNHYGISMDALLFSGVMMVSAFFAQWRRRPDYLLLLPTAVYSILCVLIPLSNLVFRGEAFAESTLEDSRYTLFSSWLFVVLLWCFSQLAKDRIRYVALMAALFTGVVSGVQYRYSWDYWYSATRETEEEDYTPLYADEVFSRQPAHLQKALAQVKDRRGKPDTFFITVAGDGFQDVFRKEALFARQQMNTFYGTKDTSVALINNSETVHKYPLATVPNLDYVVQALGRRADAQDTLVLFLTSHGSKKQFSIQLPDMEVQTLTARTLRAMLDDSGFHRKIVIISACYSGSFIAELRNSDTLIITAAAADKTSFGCADDANLTYFGEAFFKNSLPKATTLAETFTLAHRDVTKREKDEKLSHNSNPQISFGKDIKKYLQNHPLAFTRPVVPSAKKIPSGEK